MDVNFIEVCTNTCYFLGSDYNGSDQYFLFSTVIHFFLIGVSISLSVYVIFLAVATLKKALTASS
jgi:hypothetical protein